MPSTRKIRGDEIQNPLFVVAGLCLLPTESVQKISSHACQKNSKSFEWEFSAKQAPSHLKFCKNFIPVFYAFVNLMMLLPFVFLILAVPESFFLQIDWDSVRPIIFIWLKFYNYFVTS